MNDRTEKAVRDIIMKYSWDVQRCTDKLINSGLFNSQPLNLDVKVDDDWELLEEPNHYQLFLSGGCVTSNHETINKWRTECKAYQQAKTIRQRRDELIEERDAYISGCQDACIKRHKEVEQLTKERDELKERLKSFEPSSELDTQITHVVIDGKSVPIKDVRIARISSELKAKQQ